MGAGGGGAGLGGKPLRSGSLPERRQHGAHPSFLVGGSGSWRTVCAGSRTCRAGKRAGWVRRELDECGVRVPGRAGLGGARAWRSSRRALRWERLPFPQRPAAAFRAAADSQGKGVLHGRGAEPGGPGSHRGPAAAGVPAVGCSSRFIASSERSAPLCARCLSLGLSVPVRRPEAARPAVLPTGPRLCPVRSPCRVSGVRVRVIIRLAVS